MKDEDRVIIKAMEKIKEHKECLPTEEQKDIMLRCIMNEINVEETTILIKMKRFIFEYPWRVAFCMAVLQSIVCTLIFSTSYTNLFL